SPPARAPTRSASSGNCSTTIASCSKTEGEPPEAGAVKARPPRSRPGSALRAVGVRAASDVLDEGGAGRLPPEQLARVRARGGHIETDEPREEAKALVGLV